MNKKSATVLRLKPNQVFLSKNLDNAVSGRVRLLHIDNKYNEAVLFTLDDIPEPTARIKASTRGTIVVKNLEWFRKRVLTGCFELTQFDVPSYLRKQEEELPSNYVAIRNRRVELLRPILSDPLRSGIYVPALRHRLLTKVAGQSKSTVAHLYQLIYRYWRYGQVENALLPDYPRSGAKRKIRQPGDKKRGRPRKVVVAGHDPTKTGINIASTDRENINLAAEVFHLKGKRNLKDTYHLMIETCYSVVFESDGRIEHLLQAAHLCPTESQFRAWARHYLSEHANRIRQLAPMRYAKTARARPGRVTDRTRVPTDTFEFDATLANVWLVSRYDPRRLIGKVVVYFVVDRATTMITGMHTALEGPSWNAARIALYWAMSDKVEYCAHYGIKIDPTDWPCKEKPRQITSDWGEAISKNAKDSLQRNLGIASNPNAYGRPDRKPVVESRFKFVVGNVEWVKGGYKGRARDWREDTGKDPRFDAVLDIETFTRILIYEVLDHNNNQRVNHLRTDAMRRDNVPPYRRDIYLWGLDNLLAEEPAAIDKEQLFVSLLPSQKASIRNNGLLFKGRYYLPEQSDTEALLSKAKRNSIPIQVYFEPNGPRTVWTRNADDNFEAWYLAPGELEKWGGTRFEEVEDQQEVEGFEASEAQDMERRGSFEKRRKSNAEQLQAAARQRAFPQLLTKADRTKGIREERKREAAHEGQRNRSSALLGKQAPLQPGKKMGATIARIDDARAARRRKLLEAAKGNVKG